MTQLRSRVGRAPASSASTAHRSLPRAAIFRQIGHPEHPDFLSGANLQRSNAVKRSRIDSSPHGRSIAATKEAFVLLDDRRAVEQQGQLDIFHGRTAETPALTGRQDPDSRQYRRAETATSELRNATTPGRASAGKCGKSVGRRLRVAAVPEDDFDQVDAAAVVTIRRSAAHSPKCRGEEIASDVPS